MKYAVITRADDNIKEMTDITFGPIKDYCYLINADFIVLDHEPEYQTHDNRPHYRIFKTYDYYDHYDRILNIDADVLIAPNAPNLFKVVHPEKIGTVYEDVGIRGVDRIRKIKDIQREWGDVGWKQGYTNAGVFVTSKMHRDIFQPYEGKAWFPDGSFDLHGTYLAHKYNFEFQTLSYKYNHMIVWPHNDRFKSYFIHYAGAGWKSGNNSKVEQIKQDYEVLYG